jgi:hypothetical protein
MKIFDIVLIALCFVIISTEELDTIEIKGYSDKSVLYEKAAVCIDMNHLKTIDSNEKVYINFSCEGCSFNEDVKYKYDDQCGQKYTFTDSELNGAKKGTFYDTGDMYSCDYEFARNDKNNYIIVIYSGYKKKQEKSILKITVSILPLNGAAKVFFIVIGILIVVLIGVCILICCCCCKKKEKEFQDQMKTSFEQEGLVNETQQ